MICFTRIPSPEKSHYWTQVKLCVFDMVNQLQDVIRLSHHSFKSRIFLFAKGKYGVYGTKKYISFAGWEVRTVENCDRGHSFSPYRPTLSRLITYLLFSLVCCNGVCKSGLSFTKNKFEWHTPTRHKGMRLFLKKFLQFLLCNLRYKSQN